MSKIEVTEGGGMSILEIEQQAMDGLARELAGALAAGGADLSGLALIAVIGGNLVTMASCIRDKDPGLAPKVFDALGAFMPRMEIPGLNCVDLVTIQPDKKQPS